MYEVKKETYLLHILATLNGFVLPNSILLSLRMLWHFGMLWHFAAIARRSSDTSNFTLSSNLLLLHLLSTNNYLFHNTVQQSPNLHSVNNNYNSTSTFNIMSRETTLVHIYNETSQIKGNNLEVSIM